MIRFNFIEYIVYDIQIMLSILNLYQYANKMSFWIALDGTVKSVFMKMWCEG